MAEPTLTLTRQYSPSYSARIGYTLPYLSDTDSPYPVISEVDGVFPASTPSWPSCVVDGTQSPSGGTLVYFNTSDGKRTYYFHAGTVAVASLVISEGMTLVYSGSVSTSYSSWGEYNAAVGTTLYFDLPIALLRSDTEYSFDLTVTVTSNHKWEYWQEQVDRWDHWECPQFVSSSSSSGTGTLTDIVNRKPVISDVLTNGQTSPKLLNAATVTLEFTITDDDGPTMKYSVEAGPVTPSGFGVLNEFSADVGRVVGGRDFSISYTGPFTGGVEYAWRVMAEDKYTYGDGVTPWSPLNYFRVNGLPYVTSLKMDGLELLTGVNQKIGQQDVLVEWDYVDPEGIAQTAYRLVLTPTSGDAITYEATSASPSFTIGLIPPGEYSVSFSVKDDLEYGIVSTGSINVNARPVAANLKIDGEVNPSNVGILTPVIEWTFQDDDANDSQQKYRVQVALDSLFQNLVWDTGEVVGASDTIVYGTVLPSPYVSPVTLTHSKYYFRVWVYDGTSWSSPESYGSFYVNTPPGSPALATPSMGTYSGTMSVTWVPSSPLDPDGDDVTYVVEMTDSFSHGTGWEQVAGPLPSTSTSASIDLTNVKSGDDYAVRVIASDGITTSDPDNGGTSPAFSVANHAPSTPVFIGPAVGSTQPLRITVEWQEADPVDIDDDAVVYKIWLTQDGGVTWELVKTIPAGNSRTVIDCTDRASGTCNLRMVAVDEAGAEGSYSYSGEFQLDNSSAATDFEVLNGTAYVSTIDGKLRKSVSRSWTFEESWNGATTGFDEFREGSPDAQVVNGKLVIAKKPGSTFILRQG